MSMEGSWRLVVSSPMGKQSITVALHDEADQEVWRWVIDRAFPVKWTGTDMDAGSSQVTVESVELAHEGIHKG